MKHLNSSCTITHVLHATVTNTLRSWRPALSHRGLKGFFSFFPNNKGTTPIPSLTHLLPKIMKCLSSRGVWTNGQKDTINHNEQPHSTFLIPSPIFTSPVPPTLNSPVPLSLTSSRYSPHLPSSPPPVPAPSPTNSPFFYFHPILLFLLSSHRATALPSLYSPPPFLQCLLQLLHTHTQTRTPCQEASWVISSSYWIGMGVDGGKDKGLGRWTEAQDEW